ncbi:MAG: peptide/nickel transport system substrate-binding protein, partial [Aliidongia sp.]|nr:peptide/nickel transport system substrate-binding protein [Aliidongia sp.]
GSRGIDVTFELAPDLAWDDGVPVTSADVLFGIAVAHKLGRGAAALSNILDAVAQDDHHFTLRVSSVRFDYNRMEDLFLLPAHLEKAAFESAVTPADYRAHSRYTTDPTAIGLSYGPYRVASVDPNEIVLVRNPRWAGKQPHFDRIELRQFTDLAAAGVELVAGRIDMFAGETGSDLGGVYRLEAQDKNSAYNFIYKPTLNYEHIDINLSNDILRDKRIRKALLLSLDRPIAIEGRDRRTMGEAPRSFLPPASPNFDPTLPLAPYDPPQAALLFDSAGFARGADGIRVDPQGRRLAFRLAAQLDFALTRRIVEKIRDQWHDAGVDITFEDRRMSETLPKRQFDLAFYTWTNVPEFLLEPVYGKSGIPSAENEFRGFNFPGFDNDEMNKVVAALAREMAPGRRLLLWRRAQQIYADELPALPVAFVPQEYILPAAMTGVEPTGHMIPISYWVEDWKLR